MTFRKATVRTPIPWVPLFYALGVCVGLAVAARLAALAGIMALFVIMGFGLSLYLNMPDPQPRERHYVFGGMYLAYALWIGLGWVAVVGRSGAGIIYPRRDGLTAIALALPAGTA